MSGSSICQSASELRPMTSSPVSRRIWRTACERGPCSSVSSKAHAWAPASSGRQPTTVRMRRSSASPLSSGGASHAVRPSRALPRRADGTSSLAQHEAHVDVERTRRRASRTARPSRRSRGPPGRNVRKVGEVERTEAQLHAALPGEGARSDRGALPEPRIAAAEPALQTVSERQSRWRRTPLARRAPRRPPRRSRSASRDRRPGCASAAACAILTRQLGMSVVTGLGEPDATHRLQHGADAAADPALHLHRRMRVGPGAIEQRDHAVLEHVGEVEEGACRSSRAPTHRRTSAATAGRAPSASDAAASGPPAREVRDCSPSPGPASPRRRRGRSRRRRRRTPGARAGRAAPARAPAARHGRSGRSRGARAGAAARRNPCRWTAGRQARLDQASGCRASSAMTPPPGAAGAAYGSARRR